MKTLFCALLCLGTLGLAAQNFSAIYHVSDSKVERSASSSWEAFLADHARRNAAGYRLLDLETARGENNARAFHGLYTQSPLEDHVERASTWADFIALKRKMVDEGYTMIDVAGVVRNESDTDFYGVWVKETEPKIHKVWLLNSYETVLDRTKEMAKDRFKIKRIHVLDVPNGEPNFIVLYHFSPINRFNFLYFTTSLEEFMREVDERRASDVQLIDFDRHRSGDQIQYVAVFQDGEYDTFFLHDADMKRVEAVADSLLSAKNLRLINLTVD